MVNAVLYISLLAYRIGVLLSFVWETLLSLHYAFKFSLYHWIASVMPREKSYSGA